MKFNASLFSFMMSSALILGSQQVLAGGIDELSTSDQDKVKNGEQVGVYTKSEVPDAPWPICKVYQWIPESTPEDAAATFSDYELQSSYVPNLKLSKISKHTKNVSNVDYTLSLPMGFGSENYTAQDTLSSYDEGGSFQVTWTVFPTKSIKSSYGSARFETLETHQGKGTLLSYTSFIFPDRWGTSLGWVVEGAKKTVRDSVTAIVSQINKERVGSPDLLQKQVQIMRTVLAE